MTKAFECAVRLLSRREHGALELRDKLKSKGFSLADAKEALDKCQDLDLQSETRFVESYCRTRIQQGYGPLKINQELNNKGVAKDLIQSVLQQEEENWLEYASAVWQKKNKGEFSISFTELQKQQRFLLYRGFGMDVINKLTKELIVIE